MSYRIAGDVVCQSIEHHMNQIKVLKRSYPLRKKCSSKDCTNITEKPLHIRCLKCREERPPVSHNKKIFPSDAALILDRYDKDTDSWSMKELAYEYKCSQSLISTTIKAERKRRLQNKG